MTRRAFLVTLGGLGVTGAVVGDAFVVEPRWLDATRAAAPDLVVLAGDSVDERGRLAELGHFLSLLPEEPAKIAVLGNWEHWAGVDLEELRRTYARHGVRLLVNQSVALERGGRRVHVTGFDDATGGRPRLDALPSGEVTGVHLALAHSPVCRDRLGSLNSPRRPDLVLSGHTHGGQLDLLGWRPFLPPGSGRYVEGWYGRAPAANSSELPLYVSRGIGTSVLPARFGARPEVAVLAI